MSQTTNSLSGQMPKGSSNALSSQVTDQESGGSQRTIRARDTAVDVQSSKRTVSAHGDNESERSSPAPRSSIDSQASRKRSHHSRSSSERDPKRPSLGSRPVSAEAMNAPQQLRSPSPLISRYGLPEGNEVGTAVFAQSRLPGSRSSPLSKSPSPGPANNAGDVVHVPDSSESVNEEEAAATDLKELAVKILANIRSVSPLVD